MARDVEMLEQKLRAWMPDGDKITGVRVLSAGHSNETYLIDGLNQVLRLPPSEAGLLPPYDMPKQYNVLKSTAETPGGPPVPRVHTLCEDTAVLGDQFFTMETLQGEAFEYAVPDWLAASPPETRTAMSRAWLDAVAALHVQPVDGYPAEHQSPVEFAQHWLTVAEQSEAHPNMIALLRDFVSRPPRRSGPDARVHGDTKHGNVLWRQDGTMVALLDWEMSHIGEPLTDLGYMMFMYNQPLASAGLDLPGWCQPPEMIARWEEKTGREAVDVKRYQVLSMAKIGAIIAAGFHMYRTGATKDERFAAWGTVLPIYQELLDERADQAEA